MHNRLIAGACATLGIAAAGFGVQAAANGSEDPAASNRAGGTPAAPSFNHIESARGNIPARMADAIAEAGINVVPASARVVGTSEDMTVVVARTADGNMVLSISRPGAARVTTTESTPEQAADGHLILSVMGPETGGESVVVGVAPDEVSNVVVTDANGTSQDTPVDRNVFATHGAKPAVVGWTAGSGHSTAVDLQPSG